MLLVWFEIVIEVDNICIIRDGLEVMFVSVNNL